MHQVSNLIRMCVGIALDTLVRCRHCTDHPGTHTHSQFTLKSWWINCTKMIYQFMTKSYTQKNSQKNEQWAPTAQQNENTCRSCAKSERFFFFFIQMRVGRQVHIPMLLTMKFSSIHSVRLMVAANCFCIYIYIYMFVGSVLYSIFQHIFLPNFNHFAHVCITLRTTCSHHNQQSVNTIDFINDILSAI